MRNLWHEWKVFSLEKKLTTVIVPLVVVVIAAILAPAILDRLKPSPPAKVLGAKLENLHVATHVTLDEFSATQKTASLPSGGDGMRMAAVVLQDVTVSASIPQRLLGFGDLIVDNASELGGTTVLHNISNPRHYADLLLRQLRRWH